MGGPRRRLTGAICDPPFQDSGGLICVVDWHTGRVVWPEPAVLTPDLLVAAVGCSRAAAVRFAPYLEAGCQHYAINTEPRLAAFLAQIGHESGSFAYVREIASGEAYEGRRDLGNTHQGDGVRFAGKGLIQLTGRANYRDMTRWLGWSDCPDFEAHPDELAAPRWAALSACAYWASRDLNALADAGDFEGITRKINGGLNGHADRVVRLQRARQALAGQIDVGAPITTAPIPAQPPAPAAPPAAEVDASRGRVQKPPKTEHIPAGESGDAPENSMPPFIAAGLSALIQHAPALIRVFGDSPQAEKNAKAAEVVAGIAQQVTGQPTVEGAIQVLDTNPTTAAAYREAVHQSMPELLGLLVQATEVDEKTRATALDRNLQLGQATGGRWLWLLGAVVILVLVMSYAITVGVLFLPRSPEQGGFSLDTKALLIGQIVILGFATVLAWLFGSNIANRLSQQANLTKDKP